MFLNKGVLYMELEIDGITFSSEDISVDTVLICSNVMSLMPTAQLVIRDVRNTFGQKITLADGMEVNIFLGPDENNWNAYVFRVFSFEQLGSEGATVYKIDCYWNAPKYISEISTKYYDCTSSEAISQIIGESNLGIQDMDSTSDEMVWLARNKKYGHLAKEIALHGYASDSSIMCLGVNLMGNASYRNLTNIPQGGPKFVNAMTEGGGILVLAAESINKAGFFNHYTGYNHKIYEQSSIRDDRLRIYSKAEVRKISNYLMMHRDVKGDISKGKREFVPFEVGNVHEHYQQAFYQNNRGMAQYNLGQHLIVRDHTEVQLFDPIIYQSNLEASSTDAKFKPDNNDSGNYIVAGRNLHVVGGLHYSEKITVLRTGYNDDPSGTATQL